jgi:hypothetical protein
MRFVCTTLVLALSIASLITPATAQQIDVVNNQPFPIHMPLVVRGVRLADGATAAQQVGDDAVVIVNAEPSTTSRVQTQIPENVRLRNRVELKPAENAIGVTFDGKDLGRLAWGVVARPVDPKGPKTQEKALDTKGDFAAEFQPLKLSFTKTGEGPVFETWSASGSASGLKLDVELLAYRAGFLDINARYANESAPTEDVYAAIICRWEQPNLAKRVVCYDNKPMGFEVDALTPFRHGEGRHLYIQRGVDWINSAFDGGASALWLQDFTPNFTTHHGPREATAKTGPIGPRWLGANTAQVAQEAQAKGDAVYSISEIARPNLGGYASRLADNVLPPKGEGLLIASRMIFDGAAISDDRADQQFIAYTGFNPQEKTAGGAKVSFGVPFARFGTNYFPYSTLGENFVTVKQPGMSKDGYWPLAPETVKQYKLFADEIKRDLRIAKAMGFELIRLHHVELLWDKDTGGKEYVTEQQRNEYLDFYFNELKHLGLKALLDIKVSPEETARFVKRYRDLIDGVEIDNEILIFQIYDADVQYWKDVYKAVKEVAPDMPVHLTTHTNTGAFDRLSQLGVPFDRVGAHAYMDSLEAINSGKNYGLAIADYATKVNKPPLITEWNWRFLTRMTPEARAKVYRPIFENLLMTRAIPIIYQFQFQDGLAMNPTGLKGIRHYEQLNLSRRPKPEAMEMVKLIQEYSDPNAPTRKLRADYAAVELKDGKGTARIPLVNQTDKTLKLKATVESSGDVKANAPATFEIKPGESPNLNVEIELANGKDALPGFYHVFVRLEGDDSFVRYAWAEARHAGAPKIDPHTSAEIVYSGDVLKFDFNRPIAVVYPVEASVMELEAAWVLYQTLESTTGRVVDIFQATDLPDDIKKRGGIIYVSKGKADKPTIMVAPGSKHAGEQLIVTGKTPEETTLAAMDLTLRYWKTAKDSGASKVGLAAEATGKGGVKTDLD